MLEGCARALYGPNWQGPFGREFDINKRTVRDMAAGKARVPESLAVEIYQALNDRHGEILEALAFLRTLVS